MQISWNGLGSFTITAKPSTVEVSLVTNPFNVQGQKMRSQSGSMIVRSHDGKDTDNVSAVSAEHPETRRTPFVIDHAGEFEISGLFVTGIYAPKKDGSTHAIYRFDAEGLRVGFLGALDRPLKTNEVEALGPIDILLVPSGGQDVLTAAQAAEVVAQIEPRQVIPAYVGSGSYSTAESLQKALGCPSQSVNKLKIGKTNLPEDLECILFS